MFSLVILNISYASKNLALSYLKPLKMYYHKWTSSNQILMEFMFFKFFQNSEHLDQNENIEKTSNVLMQTTAARKYYII